MFLKKIELVEFLEFSTGNFDILALLPGGSICLVSLIRNTQFHNYQKKIED